MKNRTLLQGFEWYLPDDGEHWNRLKKEAPALAKAGVTHIWLPPAYKGQGGIHDVGYGTYDMYDLGEFDQKGSVKTKYGSKKEYLSCIKAMHEEKIEVLGDIVFNHRMGADETEVVRASRMNSGNRNETWDGYHEIEAWTRFTYPARKGKYSKMQWNYTHFDGVDYDARTGQNGVFLFEGKHWDDEVDGENGNFDYLMGADFDLEHPEVINELTAFGKWYTDMAQLDGYRLDAVKHMDAAFYRNWLSAMREYTKKEMFTVGEFWSPDVWKLKSYIDKTCGEMSLFDVPLHFKFHRIGTANSGFPMTQLFAGTLTEADSWHSVTFVENHDTQPGQALQSSVAPWFKPIAYALILLQERGVPCVFYGDLYGIPHENLAPVTHLETLMKLRQSHAHGPEHDYYNDDNIVGFTREGETVKKGLALLLSDGAGGSKRMYVGTQHAGQAFIDILGNCPEEVVIEGDGNGVFRTEGGNVSVWIPKK
ncbi:MAG: alpha-amylase [Lachnospiraceae bacterium]|nr:alpha-amylase [Lachnospiraceae bacterium]